ncbi:NAD(P)-binding protein [Tothia fuscella]|uniref:Peroxisomal hydratase-dehydrogenase-epimerase n=1 Tax=Tothia fuscella TaxID=1048955 RepID=A0A9P4NJN7_9PEZI|nr:NAD(P)-binding protein [Tothia fuscella]
MAELRYDHQVVVVTGAGSGLGKEYAQLFAARGAKVVVNDLGGSIHGTGSGASKAADDVVSAIKAAGGIAVADYNSVEFGDKIVQTAIQNFGRIDVLVNNAGILRDITIKNMTDEDWDIIMAVHVTGPYRTTRAAWPFFKKQKYGRVINTSSSSGLFGNFGQANYAAAKLGLVGFTETLAKEGLKYNILVNVLAPGAGSRLTETVWPPDMMAAMHPKWVAPLVTTLAHPSCKETGSIFEAAAGHFSKIRWQRSDGLLLRADETLTPDVVLCEFAKIGDFNSKGARSDGVGNMMELLEKGSKLPKNNIEKSLDFNGRVALVTGGGDGLGRAYCLLFAKLGAKVVVNDVTKADSVVQEIRSSGGEAIAVNMSVEHGDAVVKAVIDVYGHIDIIVNNAGILRDKAFSNMTDDLWFPVMNIHLRGTYKVMKAAWPYMTKQKYGRIVNITSTSGIYGNFGQSNYATAKLGILGLARTAAREGQKNNIIINSVAPSAGTNMTRTVRSEDQVAALKPEYVAPLIVALTCEHAPVTGKLYEAGCGWFGETRWERARGVDFPHDKGVPPTPEEVFQAFGEICNFDNGLADNPETPADGSKYSMGNLEKSANAPKPQQNSANRKYISKIHAAMSAEPTASPYAYTKKEVILYNLSLGAKRTDLPLVYEHHDSFQVLPTFGVIPTYFAKASIDMNSILPNFDPRMLLHGEQYLEILQYPVPTEAKLVSKTRLIEVVDKGNAAVVRRGTTTEDVITGKPVFYNESTAFIRGSGGFGGARKPADRGAVTAENKAPSRSPDRVVEEKTSEESAALYRVLGDWNPLHIDPTFSSAGGFKVPILHGLATFGISGKHVVQSYGPFKNIKVRFTGTVLPGETLITEMWKEGKKVVYQVRVKESGKLCISNAAVELMEGARAKI